MAELGRGSLRNVSPDSIEKNPENPRLYFRPEELNSLQQSIAKYGIRVPLAVYEGKNARFVLIDGERRWLSAKKLNLKTVPVLVYPRPSELDNLLLMYNLHALREQWDYFTIASRIPRIRELYREQRGQYPSERVLIELTGLTQGQLRRCKDILGLPEKYKNILADELKLPKQRQDLSEDFFIEMERALRSVEIHFPDTILDKNGVRDTLIEKYRAKNITNVIEFRKLAKMATAPRTLDVEPADVARAIKRVFNPKDKVGIESAFQATVETRLAEHRATIGLESAAAYLEELVESGAAISGDLRKTIVRVRKLIDRLLGG